MPRKLIHVGCHSRQFKTLEVRKADRLSVEWVLSICRVFVGQARMSRVTDTPHKFTTIYVLRYNYTTDGCFLQDSSALSHVSQRVWLGKRVTKLPCARAREFSQLPSLINPSDEQALHSSFAPCMSPRPYCQIPCYNQGSATKLA